uniref:Uncharacterized protein n=1 Tax=Arundo donax TaxID=35708 RepID=A0A0A8ZBA9_ARUDO
MSCLLWKRCLGILGL